MLVSLHVPYQWLLKVAKVITGVLKAYVFLLYHLSGTNKTAARNKKTFSLTHRIFVSAATPLTILAMRKY